MIYRGYVRCNPMTSCIAPTLCTATLTLNTYTRTYILWWWWWWWKLNVNMHCKQIIVTMIICSWNTLCVQEWIFVCMQFPTPLRPLFQIKCPLLFGQFRSCWNMNVWYGTEYVVTTIKVDILEIRLLNIVYCKHFDSQ